MEINKAWEFDESQSITVNGREYDVHECIRLAVDLEVRELPLRDMYAAYSSPTRNTLRSFVEHMKMVQDADLEFPILMNEDGDCIDGKHRMAKAMLLGCETIKAKRFLKDPPSGYRKV